MASVPSPRYRLLALDVDGTLLDSAGHLRPATRSALERAIAAGIAPVLCTGRRYRRARPIAEDLGLPAPIVCNSGSLVKEPATHQTLWRADLEPDLVTALLDLFRKHDQPAVSWTDWDPAQADFLIEGYPTGRLAFDEYVALNESHAGIVPGWTEQPHVWPHFHLCAIGTRDEMLAFENRLHQGLAPRLRTFVQRSPRYLGFMCEVLHAEASKWSAVWHLARLWGIAPAEICAVGDDRNDVPMILGAGLGVAMGHAPPEVLAVADHITASTDEDGVARLVDDVLLA